MEDPYLGTINFRVGFVGQSNYRISVGSCLYFLLVHFNKYFETLKLKIYSYSKFELKKVSKSRLGEAIYVI